MVVETKRSTRRTKAVPTPTEHGNGHISLDGTDTLAPSLVRCADDKRRRGGRAQRSVRRGAYSTDADRLLTLVARTGTLSFDVETRGLDSVTRKALSRFKSKISIDVVTGCWLWTAGKVGSGYGAFKFCGKQWTASKWIATIVYGNLGELEPDHLCRVRACANPTHLEPVTHKTNVLRGVGPTAVNAVKTECIRGHSFTGYNLVVNSIGHRSCRSCAVDRIRRWRKVRRL